MKTHVISVLLTVVSFYAFAQDKIVTTGNNLITAGDPMSADVVIGSSGPGVNGATGVRHDGSIMWWSSGSASRISNSGDTFYLSVWNTATANTGLAATVGASSFFKGNLGLFTTTPKAPIDIAKPLTYGDLSVVLARLPEGNGEGQGTYLGVKGYDTQINPYDPDWRDVKSFAIEHSFYGQTNSSIAFLRGGNRIGGSIAFSTNNNTERMRILDNGYVGIGTRRPDALLSVNGTIHSQEVKVDMQGWGDYVFEPNYKLLSLPALKTYLNKNHHLPEMPSAAEIEKGGAKLGELVKLQMKKIEELTLYLLKKDQEIQQQRKELTALQKRFRPKASHLSH